MDSVIKDIRYGVRGLLKHPGFTAIVAWDGVFAVLCNAFKI